jgi:threonine/homoserine/homoserine lactone efflux protein
VDASLELLAIAAVAFAVGLSGALSPGPLSVLAIREATVFGVRAGPLATLGHGIVEAALVVALALGLSRALEGNGAPTALIGLAGGAILVYLGVALLRSLPRAELAPAIEAGARAGARTAAAGRVVLLGALVSVGNPYWVIWWASVGTKLTADSLEAGVAGPGAFFAGHILSDLAWLTLLASAVHSGRRWFGRRAYRGLLAVCGVFLVALGVFFVGSGVVLVG